MKRCHYLVVLLALMPAAALAGVPWPPGPNSCSQIPSQIRLVGTTGGQPDAAVAEFQVLACKVGSPINGCSVVIDLSGANGMRLGGDATASGGATLACSAQTVRTFTDVTGHCSFVLSGSSNGSAATPGPCLAKLYADGVFFGSIPVVAFDLDGSGGVDVNDLSIWLGDMGSQQYFGRSDYDDSGDLGANDLSSWLEVFGAGHEGSSAVAACP